MWLYQWFPLCGTMSNPPSQKYVTSIQKNNVRCQVHNSPQVPATNLLTSIGFCLRSWTLGIIFVSHATTMEVSFWFAASVVHHARRGSCLSLSLSLSLCLRCIRSSLSPLLGDDMQNLSLSLSLYLGHQHVVHKLYQLFVALYHDVGSSHISLRGHK